MSIVGSKLQAPPFQQINHSAVLESDVLEPHEAEPQLFVSQKIEEASSPISEKEALSPLLPQKKAATESPSIELLVSPSNPPPQSPHFFTPELTGKYQHRVGVESFYADSEKKLVIDVHYPGIRSETPTYRVLPESPERHPMNTNGIDAEKKQLLENLWVRSQPRLIPAEGKFPVVLFSHGMGNNHFEYQHLVEELASHGYYVVTISYPDSNAFSPFGQIDPEKAPPPTHEQATEAFEKQAGDLLFVINQLKSGAFKEKIGENIDIEQIGVIGHSLGADTALRACTQTDLIRTAIDLDGGSLRHNKDSKPTKQPVLSIGAGRAGTYGGFDPEWPAEKEWHQWHASNKKYSPDSDLQIIPNADHVDFTLQPLFNAKKTGIEKENYSQLYSDISQRIVNWFNRHLK